MGSDRQLALEFALTENFHTVSASLSDATRAECLFIDAGSLFELVEVIEVDREEPGAETGVIEPALGHAANQGHLSAFETGPDGTTGAGGLALATASAGLAVATGLALAEAFAAVFGAGPWFEIM
jgi:hypothetical protein